MQGSCVEFHYVVTGGEKNHRGSFCNWICMQFAKDHEKKWPNEETVKM